MENTLKGKVALVTGGSAGIGRATAILFAKKGAKVVVGDLDADGGRQTVEYINNSGGESLFVKTDVAKSTDVQSLIDKTVEVFHGLDFGFNNAGILFRGPEASAAQCPEEEWDRVISINLRGIWLCMKYELQQMLKQGGGAIVNTSSIAGLVALPDSAAYNASKHGVTGITRAAAIENAKAGIRVNCVCPAFIKTPMIGSVDAGHLNNLIEKDLPMSRTGEPEEVAEAVVWLCSDSASFITGHALPVDGGWVAR